MTNTDTPWSFTHTNDIHLGSPKSFRYHPARNENWATARRKMEALQPDLLVIGGDLTRDGGDHDFELQLAKDDLESLPFPVHVIPGNMDVGNKHTDRQGADPSREDVSLNVTSEKMRRFASYFGASNWTFVHKNVRFTAFYDGISGSGLPEEELMWHMLERLPDLPTPKHHVVVIHSAFFVHQMDEPNFDITKPDEYLPWYFCVDHPHRDRMLDLFRASGVNHVFSGHVHQYRPPQVVDGITFHQTPDCGGFPQFAGMWEGDDDRVGFQHCKVTADAITVDFIPVEPLSTAVGYGPIGHPKKAERDYSVAWEK